MKTFVSAMVAVGLFLGAADIANATQRLLTPQSEIGFSIRQMGVAVEGRFRKFEADVSFDPAKPQAGRIQMSIDTGSAGLGSPEIDAEVPTALWLASARFPRAVFSSTKIRATGKDQFEVAGRLSLKGVDRDIVVPVKVVQIGGTIVANGSFTIKRLDFKVGEGEWSDTSLVANDVKVKFTLAVAGTVSP